MARRGTVPDGHWLPLPSEMNDSIAHVVSKPCPYCGVIELIDVPTEGWLRWRAGELIQLAMPDLSIEVRELLISGTHLECWDLLYPEDDD